MSSAWASRNHVARLPRVAGECGLRRDRPDSSVARVERPMPDRAASSSRDQPRAWRRCARCSRRASKSGSATGLAAGTLPSTPGGGTAVVMASHHNMASHHPQYGGLARVAGDGPRPSPELEPLSALRSGTELARPGGGQRHLIPATPTPPGRPSSRACRRRYAAMRWQSQWHCAQARWRPSRQSSV